jgi:hypothetical protein
MATTTSLAQATWHTCSKSELTFTTRREVVQVKTRCARIRDGVASHKQIATADLVADGARASRAGVAVGGGNRVLAGFELVGWSSDGEAKGRDDDGDGVHVG